MILVTCGDVPVDGCYATLQEAVDASASGDTIALAPGRYAEAVTITGREVVVEGVDGVLLVDRLDGADLFTVVGGSLTLRYLTAAAARGRLIDARDAAIELELVDASSAGYQLEGGLIRAEGGSLTIDSSSLRGGSAVDGGFGTPTSPSTPPRSATGMPTTRAAV